MDRSILQARHYCFLLLGILLCFSPRLKSQDLPPENGDPSANLEDFSVKIGVEEVRLDAVVVDRQGRQIYDLTTDDFEIYQDGKRQKITASKYVTAPRKFRTASGSGSAPTREEVNRTIVFIFDNLGMDATQVDRARTAMRKFVDAQMLPGDLVAIVPTAGGNAATQIFTSDKRELLSMVENVRWYMNRQNIRATPQLLAYSYCIRALREMPGRKYVLLISAQTDSVSNKIPSGFTREQVRARVRRAGLDDEGPLGGVIVNTYADYLNDMNPAFAAYTAAMDRLADASIRAGVVIHSMDIRGVDYYEHTDWHSIRSPLPKRTGGLFITSNFFNNGIGEVNEEMKGYYLLSYIPAPDTFRQGKDVFHRIIVKAKRPGSNVHAREGFYATERKQNDSAVGDSLREALFSPFRHGDLSVRLASGYIRDASKGYLLQASLHLDARGMQIVEKEGKHSISFEIVGATLDINGDIQDTGRIEREIRVADNQVAWIREHGIRCSLSMPSKNPGSYYIRIAVRDKASGKSGSAYQFVEVPDLKRGALALSSIFITDADANAAMTGEMEHDSFPRAISGRSPAQRSYRSGESIDYLAYVYNAKGMTPDLEYQVALYGNGKEIYRSSPESMDLSAVNDLHAIPLKKKLHLENGLQPGAYMLQLLVRDKQAGKNSAPAAQTLNFEILQD